MRMKAAIIQGILAKVDNHWDAWKQHLHLTRSVSPKAGSAVSFFTDVLRLLALLFPGSK